MVRDYLMIERATVDRSWFNERANLPHELRIGDFESTMQDVYDFFFDVNSMLLLRGLHRSREDKKVTGKLDLPT